jgi:hypothetical protein
MDFNEIVVLDAQALKTTSDGYLVSEPRVARSGIQIYKGTEVGKPEMEQVRVFRPEDVVFDRKSMQTFAHRPITIGHSGMVNANNWGDLAVGTTGGDVVRDGEYLRVSMMIADAEAIELIKDQHKELSVGYLADLEWKEGKTPSGELYDAVQSNIRANHVAVVARARGGSKLRLGDNTEENDMPVNERKFTIDGVDFMMGDTEGSMLQSIFNRQLGELKSVKDTLAAEVKKVETKDGELVATKKIVETKDGEIIVLKQQVKDAQLTPEQLDARVTERLGVASKVKAVLGDSFSIAGKTDMELRRLCVAKKLGEETAKAMSDANIEGAFITLTAEMKPATRQLADAFSQPSLPPQSPSDVAWAERNAQMADAWRGGKAN